MPPVGITKQELDELFETAERNLHKLSKTVLEGLKPPSGAYSFFNHNAHALSRLQDCKKILERLHSGRTKLNELAREERRLMPKDWPSGTPYPENVQVVMREEGVTSGYMQIDMESLYIWGGILLDQWAIQAIAVGALKSNRRHPFIELLDFFESGDVSLLNPVWQELKKEMLWLHYHMRFYRNRFIVHATRPWQRGTTRTVIGEDFNLHTPTPPGWEDDESLDAEIRSLLHLAPNVIRDAPDDYHRKKHAGALIEEMFENIPNLLEKVDREKVAQLFGRKGGLTPTFQVLAKHLFIFVGRGTEILTQVATDNLNTIDLGKPFATSQEMWKKDIKDSRSG